MNNIYVYQNGSTLILDEQPPEDQTKEIYTSVDNVDPAVKLNIRRIAAKSTSSKMLDNLMDGAIFRYINDYSHLERIELFCTESDIKEDRYKEKYNHKLPALIIHDRSDSCYGKFHRKLICEPFAQPFHDARIRFYFKTCDIDFVYDNDIQTEVIPFPSTDQPVWIADFAQVADRFTSLFGDYAETMFNKLGTLNDQLHYAMRVVKIYPDRQSFYKEILIANAQRAANLCIWQNNSEHLSFVLNLAKEVTLTQLEKLLDTAQSIRATSCTALLLNYKNSHFTAEEIDEYETEKFFNEIDDMPVPDSILMQNYIFSDQKDGTFGIARCNCNETNVTIPKFFKKKQVCTIRGEAFRGCTDIQHVFIPEGVTEIGKRAFSGCNNISSITLPQSVVTMGENVFEGCTSLADANGYFIKDNILYAYIGTDAEITLPDNIKEIYNRAFSKSRVTDVTVPEGIQKIGPFAFSGCNLLRKITLPESLHAIGEHAFSECGNLSEIKLPTDITVLESEIFKGCASLKNVSLPNNLTKIGLGAFKDCKSLFNLIIPNNVNEIGDHAFQNCKLLEDIVIPESVDLKNCDSLFENCSGLKKVTLPDSCKEIGRNWFTDCSCLTEIDIPDNVTRINNGAFSGCSSLETLTLPNGLTQITANAFRHCSNLVSLIIPANVSNISASVFSFCSSLKKITLPDSCAMIATEAFLGCYSLESIDIPPTCQAISDRAFSGCTNLKTAIILDDCKSIGNEVFDRCDDLTIHVSNNSYAMQYAEKNGIDYKII